MSVKEWHESLIILEQTWQEFWQGKDILKVS